MSKEKEIAVQKNPDDIKLASFATAQEAISFAEVLIASKLVPQSLKTPESVVAVILQGKELGFGPVTSLNNINNIQGKPTLSIHAIAAKISQAGIAYKLVQDFEEIVKQIDGEDKIVDRITTFEFYKKWNGETITNRVSYRWSEATKAGYTTKDNWQKMPRIMLRTRALTIGARIVAPEAILGLYETSEMADVKGVNYETTEEGVVTILD